MGRALSRYEPRKRRAKRKMSEVGAPIEQFPTTILVFRLSTEKKLRRMSGTKKSVRVLRPVPPRSLHRAECYLQKSRCSVLLTS